MTDELETTIEEQDKKASIGITIGAIVALLILGGIIYLLLLDSTPTEKIRDITLIFLGVEGLLIGVATVVLIIQIARMVNMIQTEVKPVLDSANETMNTVKGTAIFLSDNLVEPVMKVSGYMAIFKKAADFLENFGTKDK